MRNYPHTTEILRCAQDGASPLIYSNNAAFLRPGALGQVICNLAGHGRAWRSCVDLSVYADFTAVRINLLLNLAGYADGGKSVKFSAQIHFSRDSAMIARPAERAVKNVFRCKKHEGLS